MGCLEVDTQLVWVVELWRAKEVHEKLLNDFHVLERAFLISALCCLFFNPYTSFVYTTFVSYVPIIQLYPTMTCHQCTSLSVSERNETTIKNEVPAGGTTASLPSPYSPDPSLNHNVHIRILHSANKVSPTHPPQVVRMSEVWDKAKPESIFWKT